LRIREYSMSLAWLVILCVILLGIYFPSLNHATNCAPKYSFHYFLFYFLLSFNLCSSFKRQQKYTALKRNALLYALILTFVILLLVELTALNIYPERMFQGFWNLLGITGAYIGMLSFRLLYYSCY
jgi:hypothetical protein